MGATRRRAPPLRSLPGKWQSFRPVPNSRKRSTAVNKGPSFTSNTAGGRPCRFSFEQPWRTGVPARRNRNHHLPEARRQKPSLSAILPVLFAEFGSQQGFFFGCLAREFNHSQQDGNHGAPLSNDEGGASHCQDQPGIDRVTNVSVWTEADELVVFF